MRSPTDTHQSIVDASQAEQTRALCIFLVIQGVVSYRSVPRILTRINLATRQATAWIAHFTSVINRILRLGLGLLKQVKPITQPWLAIIDHSIDAGTKKALVVLRTRMDVLSGKNGAIELEDCECVGLRICETVNGGSVARQLGEIFQQAGLPAAIIKDCEGLV